MCQTQVNKWAEEYKRFFGIISIANQIFDYAIAMELIDSNPMRKTLKLKRQKNNTDELEKFYNKEELKEFFKIVKGFDDNEMLTYFRLLAFTGMRKNEISALRWSDIDFKKDRLLSIRHWPRVKIINLSFRLQKQKRVPEQLPSIQKQSRF